MGSGGGGGRGGGSHSLFQSHLPVPASSSTHVKRAYLIHISHSDRGNADLRSRRGANAPRQQKVPCQNLPFEFLQPYCEKTNVRRNRLRCNLYHFNACFNSPLLRQEVPGRVGGH